MLVEEEPAERTILPPFSAPFPAVTTKSPPEFVEEPEARLIEPDDPKFALPVFIWIAPLMPFAPDVGVISVTWPLDSVSLLPLSMYTFPPVADKLFPALILMSTPFCKAAPTSIDIPPATPFGAEPDDMVMEPDEPAAESPVDNIMLPLDPALPASDVRSFTLPEVVSVL